jgi:O2-independent ubiquinone biosynthesis accessory factor UbiT
MGILRYPPRLPRPLTAPLALVPGVVHSTVLITVLNRVFRDLVANGELEFLQGRLLCIRVQDAPLEYRFMLATTGFMPCSTDRAPDLTIAGSAFDLMTLATRHEDSDTLFFHRRLVLEGDTALGLQLKNLLDGMEVPESVAPVLQGLQRAVGFYERLARSS